MPGPPSPSLVATAAQLTRAGRKASNEDCVGIRLPEQGTQLHKGVVACIADGVSQAHAGKEAAEVSVQGFLADYYSTPLTWSVTTAAQRVLNALNRWLYGHNLQYRDQRYGRVCTFSALILQAGYAHIFHVGDCRVQRLRNGELEQLTRDHTFAGKAGHSYLARAMGIDVNLEVDYRSSALQAGDLFLLTSDGVHDTLTHETLRTVLQRYADLDAACLAMLDAAETAGSSDNLSCQMLRVVEVGALHREAMVKDLSTMPLPPLLSKGTLFDSYYVEEELFASPRSQLYRVRDSSTGVCYVLKAPAPRYASEPKALEAFVLEEWIGSRVNSPHLVKAVTPPHPRSALYYLMEWLPGQTLATWMLAHPRPGPTEVIEWIMQLVKAVRALHRQDTLHQDLKPDNIWLSEEGRLLLLDLGGVQIAGITTRALGQPMPLGTRRYSAPEVALGHGADTRADQFAIALLAYEMLTARHPYGEAYSELRDWRQLHRLRYISALRVHPMVPLWLDKALEKALHPDPRRRYAALSEFVKDLRHPNPRFVTPPHQALLERKPLLLWKIISAVLAMLVFMLLLHGP